MAEKKKRKKHYVNNPDFLEAMIKFRSSVIEAKESGKERPRVPHYIGECLMKIAKIFLINQTSLAIHIKKI